ncbi:MAG: hypothetical protein AAFZ15_06970 [Bacteroidota bacterium]
MNKYPILSPFPVFGQDEYAYLHTLIRYNTVKAGYDASIYNARFPDYIHAGDIGPQAKVKHQGKFTKYTSLIVDNDTENLAFQISVPVRVEYKAKIQAVLFPLDVDGLSSPVPVAWSSEEYEKLPNDDQPTFRLTYSTEKVNEDAIEYFIAHVNITNIFDGTNAFHQAWCKESTKVELKSTEEEAILDAPRFLQKVIEPKNGDSKTFVLRVFMTIRDSKNKLMDQRDDSIIIDILSE